MRSLPGRFARGGLSAVLALTLAGCSAKHFTLARESAVTFYLDRPGAATVVFASSLDRYRPHPARIGRDDLWEVTIEMEKEREFYYFYLVDGLVTTPECRSTVLDDFGSRNCVYTPGL